MATEENKNNPHQQLAEALALAKKASRDSIIKTGDLEASARTLLLKAGCLLEIIKGWYLLTKPGSDGTSTAWFGGFWAFLSHYLSDRFGADGYCLGAESSLNLHAGENTIANQIVVTTKKTSNQTLELPHSTSLLLYTDAKNFSEQVEDRNGVNIMPLPIALVRASPSYFQNKSRNIELLLKCVPSVSEISRVLLSKQAVSSAARIAGAYAALEDSQKTNQIVQDMEAAGYTIKPTNPFLNYEPTLRGIDRLLSPHAGRIKVLWQAMRSVVLENFPTAPGIHEKPQTSIRLINEIYSQDAYHSLSIEGYQVTEELINKISKGDWDPSKDEKDRDQWNALAAKGYHQAFQKIIDSVSKVLKHENPGDVLEQDLQSWYRELFSPFVKAGFFEASELAGYRHQQVYISNSRYIPPQKDVVVDCMETLFQLLKEETEAAVRAVLGHFIFVYIHPYMDGNGRIGRFLMNLMLTSGGYNWTVIRTSERSAYLSALEQASFQENIIPFTNFIKGEMEYWKAQAGKS